VVYLHRCAFTIRFLQQLLVLYPDIGVVGALLVYDITDVDSFTRVKNWVRELRKIVGEEISICIAGNKCDLERHRHVAVQDAQECVSRVDISRVAIDIYGAGIQLPWELSTSTRLRS
jgi:GTPase SAR1 family protein